MTDNMKEIKMRRFSVVIPVYNVEKYLGYCLDSILGQTYQDFEIILVNDGSTDSSADICRQYQEENPEKIVLINQDNRGLLMARRVGFARTQGEIIVSVDSDDALRVDTLEILDKTFRKTQAQMVCYEATRDITFKKPDKDRGLFTGPGIFEGNNKKKLYELICGTFFFNNIWSKAISRDVIGVHDDYSAYEGLSFGEDVCQVLPVLDRASRIAYVPEALYFYRLNTSSLVHVYRQKQFDDLVAVRDRVMSYAEQWGRETGDNGLVPAARAMTLQLVALQMQDAVVSLSYADAKRTLVKAEKSEMFRDSYTLSRRRTRIDIRFISRLIRYHNVWGIRLISYAKNILLGKNRY